MPIQCLFCARVVSSRDLPVPVCRQCAEDFTEITPPACWLCAVPMGSSSQGEEAVETPEAVVCGDCRTRDLTLSNTLAGYEYRGKLRDVVADWKFGGDRSWGLWLGQKLLGIVEDRVDPEMIDAVVPIPLHEERRKERGFNQARQLGRVLADAFETPRRPWLSKIRETRPQSELSRQERLDNLEGAFVVPEECDPEGKHIMLVDDIFTTGSTLRCAATTLKNSGAVNITAVVLARAV